MVEESGPAGPRSRAIDALRDALAAVNGDMSGRVLGEDITALAEAVAAAALPDLTDDMDARSVLGSWRWARFLARAPEEQAELEEALDLWAPVAKDSPEALPPEVLPLLEAHAVEQVSTHALELAATYEVSDDPAVLDEAIDLFREVVRATPADYHDRGRYLSNLAVALRSRFEATGDLGVLDEAVDTLREAAQAMPADDERLPLVLDGFGNVLLDRFGRSGDIADVREAVAAGERAAGLAGDGDPDFAVYLSHLGDALRLSFEYSGDEAALDRAIEVGRRAVSHAGESDLSNCLSHLGGALEVGFCLSGKEEQLVEAVGCFRRAVDGAAVDDVAFASYLTNLGGALQRSFQRTGEPAALDEAITALRHAVEVAADDDPDLGDYLSNLGGALLDGFEKTGDETHLNDAIGLLFRAVDGTPAGSPYLARRLSNLSSVLLAGFEDDGDTVLLEGAVSTGRRAVAAALAGDHSLGAYLSSLGNALRTLFLRTEGLGPLDEAIEAFRRAVEVTPAGHTESGMYLTNLGVTLRLKASRMRDTGLLAEAEDVLRRATEATGEDDPFAGRYLANLANALHGEFDRGGDLPCLQEAIELYREALRRTPAEDAVFGGHLFNLGCALRSRFGVTGAREDIELAGKLLEEAWSAETAPMEVRIAAAHRAADADLAAGDAGHAVTMAERAIALLALFAPRELPRNDRGHRITGTTGIAATAATAAVVAGRAERAVELLEQSRGLLFAETLDTRGDLTLIRRRAPDLAAEFARLREELDTIDHSLSANDPAVREGVLRRWEELLARIRGTPGLAGFLEAPSISALRRAAAEGPVVYVVVHEHLAFALALHDSPRDCVDVIALPEVTEDAVYDNADLFREVVRTAADEESVAEDQEAARRQAQQVFAWTWDAVARPVLEHLGHTAPPPPGAQWPRIRWCPVGIATYLPLHAAGHHPETRAEVEHSVDTVLDRVVSSYTPTARALLHTASTGPARSQDVLVVAAAGAPESAALPGVAREVEFLRSLMPTATVLPGAGSEVTLAAVLEALPAHAIAHFACHGLSDWHDPMASHLELDDRGQQLTVSQVTALNLTGVRMAYLSACSTADTSPRHIDEATHLTSAFFLAGYRTVIGTLWPVGDLTARAVARDTYGVLTSGGTTDPDPSLAAFALHHAVRGYREFRPAHVLRWAAHVHTGH